MKNCIFFAVTAITLLSCGLQPKMTNSSSSPEEKWEDMQGVMAPGAGASNERPMPDILSEQEILLKAADYTNSIGALHPSYYLYEKDPELLTAKIETPVLVHNFTGYDDGDGAMYLLTAVDMNGECLMGAYVRPVPDAYNDSFVIIRFIRGGKSPESSTHYMAKREVITLIDSQFPNLPTSEPIAVRMKLDGDGYSHVAIFWYFTVGNNREEYIIDAEIREYGTIPGGVAGLSANGGGSPHLGWEQMAKLETPVHFFDRLEAARASGRSLGSIAAEPTPPVRFIPVPLEGRRSIPATLK